MLVCSVTAFIVLLSNPTYGDRRQGASLAQTALGMQGWASGGALLTIAIFMFAYRPR
ncbi:alanine:cation symporter family protein [Kocuria rhizophila]|nr:alanine:cation symporter family protein [Kocuria rhizophila]